MKKLTLCMEILKCYLKTFTFALTDIHATVHWKRSVPVQSTLHKCIAGILPDEKYDNENNNDDGNSAEDADDCTDNGTRTRNIFSCQQHANDLIWFILTLVKYNKETKMLD